MKYELKKFKIAGYYPYTPLKETSMELKQELLGCTPFYDIEVPGSIYDCLYRNKVIRNPYFDMNSLQCEWIADRWWVYSTYFDAPEENKRTELVFEGVADKAHYFLNGQYLGLSEGMFIPIAFDITDILKKKDNYLRIVIESAQDEIGQIGYSSKVSTQRSRFDYKWDFCIRMINMGLFRPCYLKTYEKSKIEAYHFRACDESHAALNFTCNNNDYDYEVSLSYDHRKIFYRKRHSTSKTVSLKIPLHNPQWWYPNGSGKQPLYELTISLFNQGKQSDEMKSRVGLKLLKMVENDRSYTNALPYVLSINQQKVYIRGVNLVPLDQQLGLINEKRYEQLIKKLVKMNVNFVRIWGGGVIESETFYSLCDQYGLIVWQDLIQSSSGIDNFPSTQKHFLKLFDQTNEHVCKTLRNHVSLGILCGGNELMFPSWKPVDESVLTIAKAKATIQKYCPEVPFFPTTSSGPRFSYDLQHPEQNHDIHGEWKYLGTTKHYEVYNQLTCLFHSEFGCDGLTNYSTMKKTMPSKKLYCCNFDEDEHWRHRGEWWNTYLRDKSIFGDFSSLPEQIELSQFIQAEGIRYVIDAHRRDAYHCAGSIIWQANEPFPNGSCTSVIDYFGKEKLAYYAIANSYQLCACSFRYRKLIYNPDEILDLDVYVSNGESGKVKTIISIYEDFILKKQDEVIQDVVADQSILIKTYHHSLKEACKSVLLVTQSVFKNKVYHNYALLLIRQENGFCDKQSVLTFNKILKKARG